MSLTKIAVENDSMEVVDVLWEALGEEVPEKVRLQQLSRAMYKEDKEEGRKRFRELLSYLTPDMVRFLNRNQSFNEFVIIQVATTPVNRYGSVMQDAVVEGKTEFVSLLLEHGYVLCIQNMYCISLKCFVLAIGILKKKKGLNFHLQG